MFARIKNLHGDERGVTLVEFALIAPVLLVTIMGVFDFALNFYMKSVLEGAVQKAARDSTVEQYANSPGARDAQVTGAVQSVLPSAQLSFSRSAYTSYADVGQPEDFTDTNGDGTCNNNEPFDDINGNGTWDQDRALDASSGARDAVLYTVEVTYDRKFPLNSLLGFESEVFLSATTVLRNQPYNTQEVSDAVGNCTT